MKQKWKSWYTVKLMTELRKIKKENVQKLSN